MKEELSILIQAQYPLIYLVTPEEERAEEAIAAIAQRQERKVFVWTLTRGTVEHGQPRSSTQHSTVSPQMAIQSAIGERQDAIFILRICIRFWIMPK